MPAPLRAPPCLPLLALVVTLLSACKPPPEPSWSATIQEGQAAAEEALRGSEVTSVVVALTDARRLLWVQGFGLADRVTGREASGSTLYGIGSTSKMFATVAVMQLVERGMVDLDAPLSRYVPAFGERSPSLRGVTVRMLLDHSSGLPGADYRGIFTTGPFTGYAEQVGETTAGQRLKTPPGSMTVYCNDGFTLVELLVKSVTGKDYPTYVREEILAPLGMTRSRFAVEPLPDGEVARAYRNGAAGPVEHVNAYASGGLYSTAEELAGFVRMFLDRGAGGRGRILAPGSVEMMSVDWTQGTFRPVDFASVAYGLGWDTVREPGLAAAGVRAWAKGGDSVDYHAQILVAPEAGLGVVVLLATSGAPKVAIAERVLLRALTERGRGTFPSPLRERILPVATPPDGLVARMTGTYANSEGALRVESQEDGSLRILPTTAGRKPVAQGLRLREDGWFTSDAKPLESFQLLSAGGRDYLVLRAPTGAGHYLETLVLAQRMEGQRAPLSAAWRGRVGKRWVVANERADSTLWTLGMPLRLTVGELPGVPGLVTVTGLGGSDVLLDPSPGDRRAESRVVIPGNFGRDLNDLEVVSVGGEDWLRWGSWMLRPVPSIPVAPIGRSIRVPFGPDGYGEWLALPETSSRMNIRVSGARAWRVVDDSFAPVASDLGEGSAPLPSGKGVAYLLLQGDAGGSAEVTIQPANPR